jgi:predicted flap endonuclease-1-like 5' DNA nuclease
MVVYILQTIFLLAVALVIGAIVGYYLKLMFGCKEDDASAAASSGETAASAATASASSVSSSSAKAASDTSKSSDDSNTIKAGLVSSDSSSDSASSAKAASKATAAKKSAAKKTAAPKKSAAPKAAVSSAKAAPVKSAPAKSAAKSSTTKAAVVTSADDLKLIKGVGKLNEKRLNDEGISSFAQVAAWKKADIEDFDAKLNFKGRIEREEWVPQAKALAKAKPKAAPAAKAAAKPATKTATKTSNAKPAAVKASAPKKAAAVKKAAPKKAAAVAKSGPDDLKMIKGVGKLIETKLAKEGITSFSQIAGWKKADITEFDEKLSFKGRIERDEWISQAKILAKGGTTEFSKRAAKGDVPSSS